MLRAPFALIWNLLKLISFGIKRFLFWVGQLLTRKQRKWVRLKLPSRLAFGPPAGLAAHFQDKPTYVQLREHLELLADDPRIEGVVVTADRLAHGPGRTADLRRMIRRLRREDKRVVFHAHTFHGGDYDLATEADEVVMTPGGRFYLFGHRFEQFFAGGLLDRLGVAPQFVHIGPFKTAAHRFTKTESTTPQKLMMQQVVDSLSSLREDRIVGDRQLSEQALDKCFDNMPLDSRQADAFELIDARIHRRDISRWIEQQDQFVTVPPPPSAPPAGKQKPQQQQPAGDPGEDPPAGPPEAPEQLIPETQRPEQPDADEQDGRVNIKDAVSYVESVPRYRWTPLFRRPRKVATVDLTGLIVMPGMDVPGHSITAIDPGEVLPVLESLRNDRSVASVVLHINSPGGSALASELLWDGIRRLRHEKPTLAYCSDVAASGGYYIACGADRIICQPETITGSIGVIAGKFSFPGAMEKLDVNSEAFQRYDTALFESLTEPLSQQVLENLKRDARSFYRQFLRRVGDARQLAHRRLHRYARGRIYTGADAHRRHLVDHLGGFDDAVEIARSLAEPSLDESAPVRFQPHRKVGFPALLRQSTSMTAGESLLKTTLGELEFLHDLVQRDPLLALMPYRLADTSH